MSVERERAFVGFAAAQADDVSWRNCKIDHTGIATLANVARCRLRAIQLPSTRRFSGNADQNAAQSRQNIRSLFPRTGRRARGGLIGQKSLDRFAAAMPQNEEHAFDRRAVG